MNDPVDIRLGVHVQFPTDNLHARCTVILLPVVVYKLQYVPLSRCPNAAPCLYGTRTNQENIGYIGWGDPSGKKIVPPLWKLWNRLRETQIRVSGGRTRTGGGGGLLIPLSSDWDQTPLACDVSSGCRSIMSACMCACLRMRACSGDRLLSVRQNRSLEIFPWRLNNYFAVSRYCWLWDVRCVLPVLFWSGLLTCPRSRSRWLHWTV